MATYKTKLSLKQGNKKEVYTELSTMHTTFNTVILSIAGVQLHLHT